MFRTNSTINNMNTVKMATKATNFLPWLVIGVLVALVIFALTRPPAPTPSPGNVRYICRNNATAQAQCVETSDPNGYPSPTDCAQNCVPTPYFNCGTQQSGNMTIRTGTCAEFNYQTPYNSLESCQGTNGAHCNAPQYFACDSTQGCINATAYIPGTLGSYQNQPPSTAGSDQCTAQCIQRHRCDAQGNCTDLGFSADTSFPEGTCASNPCPNTQGYYRCNPTPGPGQPACVTSTNPSDYRTLGECLTNCCGASRGSVCGNICCAPNQKCCTSSDGKTNACYDPNECQECNNGVVSSTCKTNCAICVSGKCVPQQCNWTQCQTCQCSGNNCSCAGSIDCPGSCCYNPECPVSGTNQKCSDIDPSLCVWCQTPRTPCNVCPDIPNPKTLETAEIRRQRLLTV